MFVANKDWTLLTLYKDTPRPGLPEKSIPSSTKNQRTQNEMLHTYRTPLTLHLPDTRDGYGILFLDKNMDSCTALLHPPRYLHAGGPKVVTLKWSTKKTSLPVTTRRYKNIAQLFGGRLTLPILPLSHFWTSGAPLGQCYCKHSYHDKRNSSLHFICTQHVFSQQSTLSLY